MSAWVEPLISGGTVLALVGFIVNSLNKKVDKKADVSVCRIIHTNIDNAYAKLDAKLDDVHQTMFDLKTDVALTRQAMGEISTFIKEQ